MKLSRIIALGGSIITLVQALLLAYEQKAICFSSGCEVVDSLTTIDPVFVNLAGFFFFQVVFWGIWFAQEKHQRLRYVRVVLLAGLAAEGVLISFQYLVAQVFCSYCLLILSLIAILNLLAGIRHFIMGSIIFGAVVAGFFSLQFSSPNYQPMDNIDEGTFAVLQGAEDEKRYLFFSSSCKYCEEIISSLQSGSTCGIRFNPIEEITEFSLVQADLQGIYHPAVNRAILQTFGIEQIPILLITRDSGFEFITGAGAIGNHLEKNCTPPDEEPLANDVSGYSIAPGLDPLIPGDEACLVSADCEEPGLPAQN